MRNAAKLLVVLSIAAFALAIVAAFAGKLGNIQPEGFSRASGNLALLAIALMVAFEAPANGTPGRM